MRASRALAVLLLLPGVAAAHRGRPAPVPCPDDVVAAIAEQCPCDGMRNHGQYVSCVVRYRNALRRSDCLDDTLRSLVRCAARSTCGKPAAAVVCCRPATAVCDDPAECSTMAARIARDAASCAAAGGTPAGRGSVCGGCPATTTTSTTTTSTTTTSTTTSTTTTLPSGNTFCNAVEFPDASAHSPDYLVGSPITVPSPAMLTDLAVIGKAAGADVMLALYSSPGGEPDQLVAATPSTPMTVGAMEMPVAPTFLPAGTYWIMGVYDGDASIGIDENDPNAPDCYAPHAFADALPDPFGTSFPYSGQRFNYYIRVQ